MNILIVSNGWYDYDGRLRELCKIFSRIGELYLFSNGSKSFLKGHTVSESKGYFGLIKQAFKYGRTHRNIDVLVLDDKKAIIPGYLIKFWAKPKIIIQDCRELSIRREAISLSSWIGCVLERITIRRADIVICANDVRASIMLDYYKLKELPISYENLRRLSYSENVRIEALEKEFLKYNNNEEYRILSSSGCSILRTDDILVKNINKVSKPCRLFLVGKSNPEDRSKIEDIIKKLGLSNVVILDKLDEDHLKFLIGKCHVGIVNYSRIDTNSVYCASGKVYEFLYEGLPIVTTTNPPLQEMCEKYNIGVSDDSYYEGINKVLSNYQYYKNNVLRLAEERTVEDNNHRLYEILKDKISKLLMVQ